ncbi:MAG: hypothetical protein V3T01_13690, partial [Myxococcota bacterium]
MATVVLTLGWGSSALAAEPADRERALEGRVAELERIVDVLVEELERTRSGLALPEDPELEASDGHGPAASKIFRVLRGLSIGGYGETAYQHLFNDDGGASDRWDLLRAVLYVGYKFNERIFFNSEIEFEHATTSSTRSSSGGSASVEFAELDFFAWDWASPRIGLLLLPMGFLNEIHEPPYYYGVARPDVETQIIPSTWRENGVGLFGRLFDDRVAYRMYAVAGLNAAGFTPSNLRGGRQKGNRSLAEHIAFTARIDWTPLPEFLIGGSVYHGNSGQNQVIGGVRIPDSPTTLWEAHAQWEAAGWHLRGLFAMAHIGDAGDLTTALRAAPDGTGTILSGGETIAERMIGGYAEIAYDLLPLFFADAEASFSPYYRFESYDTQHRVPSGFSRDTSKEIRNHTIGLQYRPLSNV